MIQPPAPQFSSPVFTQGKKTLKANELVRLRVYQKSRLLILVSSPMQLGSSGCPISHNAGLPKRNTHAPRAGYLRMWIMPTSLEWQCGFLKLQYKSKCLLLPLPPLFSTLPLHPTWLLYLVPIPVPLGLLCLRSFLWISFPSFFSLFHFSHSSLFLSFALSTLYLPSLFPSLILPLSVSLRFLLVLPLCVSASSFSCFLVSVHHNVHVSLFPASVIHNTLLSNLLLDVPSWLLLAGSLQESGFWAAT